MSISAKTPSPAHAFRHEALFYTGRKGFLEGTVPFIAQAVAQDEAVLVVVGAEKIELLRDALASGAGGQNDDRERCRCQRRATAPDPGHLLRCLHC